MRPNVWASPWAEPGHILVPGGAGQGGLERQSIARPAVVHRHSARMISNPRLNSQVHA